MVISHKAFAILSFLIMLGFSDLHALHPAFPPQNHPKKSDSAQIKKVLLIGDSMTGWMGERLNEFGKLNGFDVSTVVWDGSTISKWASSCINKIISQENPDAIIVSLGMNEMFEANPETRFSEPIEKLTEKFNGKPFVWIGPPSWPAHKDAETFNSWMEKTLGTANYFNSSQLDIKRQSASNPHPSRKGTETWVENIALWLQNASSLHLPTSSKPATGKISRGKTFIYKKMKETL